MNISYILFNGDIMNLIIMCILVFCSRIVDVSLGTIRTNIVVKGKNLTNTRSAGKDHTVVLKRPRQLTLEIALDYINTDELVEVTPNSIRLRKKILNANDRKKAMLRS